MKVDKRKHDSLPRETNATSPRNSTESSAGGLRAGWGLRAVLSRLKISEKTNAGG
jgi:hypothetical protein